MSVWDHPELQRASISVEALRALINSELASLTPCEGVEVASIEILSIPDARDCNWRVGAFVAGQPPEPCDSLASIVVWALQWRYNVAL